MKKELVVQALNGISNLPSYGGKSFLQNLESSEKAMSKVEYTNKIWDRSRSQWMLKFLTCSNADVLLRMRQICA